MCQDYDPNILADELRDQDFIVVHPDDDFKMIEKAYRALDGLYHRRLREWLESDEFAEAFDIINEIDAKEYGERYP